MEAVRILWLSPRWPYPADDGAKKASAALLDTLADLGHAIHVVTFARELKLATSGNSKIHLTAHYRASSLAKTRRILEALRNLGEGLPVSAAPFARFGLSWEKLGSLLPTPPDCAVIDGTHAYGSFVRQRCPWPLLYRSHNIEFSLWEQAAQQRPFPLNVYLRLQAKRMRNLEAALGEAAKGIAAISPEDGERFRAWFPHRRVEWVPMGFSFSPRVELPGPPLTFGFLGRLDWPPNRDGLTWFLKEVWPRVRQERPQARLLVAGSGDGDWLRAYSGFEFLGRIDAVEPFFANIHAALAPLHYGSGTKIKVVEAAKFGRPVFVTPQALAGSGLSPGAMAVVSEKAEDWVRAMVSRDIPWLDSVGQRAFTEARDALGAEAAAHRFLSLLS